MAPTSQVLQNRRVATSLALLGFLFSGYAIFFYCAKELRQNSNLAWINPYHVQNFGIYDSVPRNFLFPIGLLAIGVILISLEIFHKRWAAWMDSQKPLYPWIGLISITCAWTLYTLMARLGIDPIFWLSVFAVFQITIFYLYNYRPKFIPIIFNKFLVNLLLLLIFSVILKIILEIFIKFIPKNYLLLPLCVLLLCLPEIEKIFRLHISTPRRYNWIFILGTFFIGFLTTIPPTAYLYPLDLSPVEGVSSFEYHLNAFVMRPALQLSHKLPDISHVRPLYGWGYPLLMIAINRLANVPVDFATFVKISYPLSWAYFCCAFLAFYFYSGRRLLLTLILSILPLPWNILMSPPLFANLSAARYIGIPCFFLLLWKCRHSSYPVLVTVFAPTLALCALINPETSIALFGAILVYIWYRWRQEGWLPRITKTVIATTVITIFTIFCIYGAIKLTVLSAQAFSFIDFSQQLQMMVDFASGYGGLKFIIHPTPFVIGLLSISIWANIATRNTSLSPKNAYRAAAAAFILVWGAYYINRPDPINLIAHLYVFTFFIIDLLRLYAIEINKLRMRPPLTINVYGTALITILLLIVGVAPLLTNASDDLIAKLRRGGSSFRPHSSDVVSGVHIPRELLTEMNALRTVWRKYSKTEDPCLMLTAHPIFASEVTCHSDLPFADPFEAITTKDYCQLLDSLESSRAQYLFITPQDKLPNDAWRGYYAHLRDDLSAYYRLRESTPYLDVWQRRPLTETRRRNICDSGSRLQWSDIFNKSKQDRL